MPVVLDSHDPTIELTPGTTKSAVVAFLYRNDEYGYSPRDIHEALEIPHNTAKVTLKRLYDDEYVDKTPDGYYHARPDREDLFRYTGALDGLERLFTEHEESQDEVDGAERGEPSPEQTARLTDEDIEDAVALVESSPAEEDQ